MSPSWGKANSVWERPDRIAYYLGVAWVVSGRAECRGLRVGAVLVANDRVVATGYNGTPTGIPNCTEGGCVRCARRDEFPTGVGYDKCICVHAEANALLTAARYGYLTDGATAFVTHQPCLHCAKELLQAGICKLYYTRQSASPDVQSELEDDLNGQYSMLMDVLEGEKVDEGSVRTWIGDWYELTGRH